MYSRAPPEGVRNMKEDPIMAEVPAQETLSIEGMSCGHCKAAVERWLSAVKGVIEAKVTLNPGQAVVVYDPTQTDREALVKAVEDAGYSVK
jgi:copper chaperone CopZ